MTNLVSLETTIRGVRLMVAAPDAQYRRFHTDIHPAPSETRVGRAVRVEVPAREHCSAYSEWQIDGRRVDSAIYFLRAVLRDGSDAHLNGAGRWDLLGESIPANDSELLALRAEIAALDAAWLAAHTAEISIEDRRTDVQAKAAVHDESGRDPSAGRAGWTALECLECGAVYASPGSVEPGGMGCRRCA